MGPTLDTILAILTVASVFGAAAGTFYGYRNSTIIKIQRASNDAYKERNGQLESESKTKDAKILELERKNDTLVSLKTVDLSPVISLLSSNHTKVMNALGNQR